MNPSKVNRDMIRLRKRVTNLCHRNKLPFSPNTLGGACGICSFLVFRMLKKRGLQPVFHINNDHCFVTIVLDEKYWVDLTLTQFHSSFPTVFIKTHSAGAMHRSARRSASMREIRGLFSKWPTEQNPFKQKLPKFSI